MRLLALQPVVMLASVLLSSSLCNIALAPPAILAAVIWREDNGYQPGVRHCIVAIASDDANCLPQLPCSLVINDTMDREICA